MTNLNPADLQKMSASEVANLADLDFYSVRNEGFRRQDAAEKLIASLQRKLAKAQQQAAEARTIIESAFDEQRHQNAA